MVAQLDDERALLMVVDDAQWVDAPSLRWLAYLAPRVGALHAVVAIAVRTGETAAINELLDAIAAAPDTARLSVAPLSPAASEERAAARAGQRRWLRTVVPGAHSLGLAARL